jgi:hypothetical protein
MVRQKKREKKETRMCYQSHASVGTISIPIQSESGGKERREREKQVNAILYSI